MSVEGGAKRTGWGLRIVLAISLALNLLVAGLVLGAIVGRGGERAAARAARHLGPMPFVQALDAEGRATLADRMRAARPDGAGRHDMRRRLEALLDALRAEAFDAGTMVGLLEDLRREGDALHATGAQILAEHLAGLPAEERRAYADRLQRAIRRASRH